MLSVPRSIIRRPSTNVILDRHIGGLDDTRNAILTATADTGTISTTAILAHIEAAAIMTDIHSMSAIGVRHLVSIIRVRVQLRLVLRLVGRKQLRSGESTARTATGAGAVAGVLTAGGAEQTGEVSSGDGLHGRAAGGDHSDVDFDSGTAEANVPGWIGIHGFGKEALGKDDDAPDTDGGCTVRKSIRMVIGLKIDQFSW